MFTDTPRSWLSTAAAAVVGAGAIAATPLAAPALTQLPLHPVELTSSFDPLGAWESVFATAQTNVGTLTENASTPLATGQQLIADLIHGTSINPNSVLDALAQPDTDLTLSPSPLSLSNDAIQTLAAGLLPQYLSGSLPLTAEELTPVLSFLASPLSGVLIGAAGPMLSPLVALINSGDDISAALSGPTPDVMAALQAVFDIPANMVGGLLNGATLDLDGLLPTLTSTGLLPAAMDVTALSYTFGGLLSPGVTGNDVAGFVAGNDDGSTPGIGGSVMNGLGLTTGMMGFPMVGDAHGVGPLGALEGLDQILAYSLGWDGTGNPLEDVFSGGNPLDDLFGGFAGI